MPESIFLQSRSGNVSEEPADLLTAAILDINTRSVAAYLRRQQLELQRQQLQQETIRCEQELLALDGELRAVTALQQKAR